MTTEERDAVNKRIALAAGWTIDEGQVWWQSPSGRVEMFPPDYTTDANAALEAAREIVGDFTLECFCEQWKCDALVNDLAAMVADTAPLALCKMIEAVLDEKEKP